MLSFHKVLSSCSYYVVCCVGVNYYEYSNKFALVCDGETESAVLSSLSLARPALSLSGQTVRLHAVINNY